PRSAAGPIPAAATPHAADSRPSAYAETPRGSEQLAAERVASVVTDDQSRTSDPALPVIADQAPLAPRRRAAATALGDRRGIRSRTPGPGILYRCRAPRTRLGDGFAIRTTADIYGSLPESVDRAVADKFDDLFAAARGADVVQPQNEKRASPGDTRHDQEPEAVEVTRQLSNPYHPAAGLLVTAPDELVFAPRIVEQEPRIAKVRQLHRRLSPEEINDLIVSYQA